MYLNTFSADLDALDMSELEEFANLLQSARDLGLEHPATPRYRSRNTVFRHQRFHFLEWGHATAPPLVLLHGSNQSAHAWDFVSLHLSDAKHVYALDQRGHGDSEWSRGAHYGVPDMAGDAEAFLTSVVAAENGRKPIVVGHSMGGMVTLALARQRPDLLDAIVIVDIGPEVSEVGTKMIREFVGNNIEFDDMEEFLDRVEKYDRYRSREHIARTLKYNLIRRADGRYVPKADRRRFRPEESDDGTQPRVPGAPTLDDMRDLDLPVLVVRGGDSNVLDADAAQRFADALPHGRLVTVPGCGHNVASQNTLGFLNAVRTFLAR